MPLMDSDLQFLGTHVVVSGMVYEPDKIKPVLDPATADGRSVDALSYGLRFSSFEHRWWCNTFKTCRSAYNVRAFIIDRARGEKIRLKAVETAMAIQGLDAPIDFDPSHSIFYRHTENVTDFYIGCGEKDGQDSDFWGVARCYFESGEVLSWRWSSHA